MEAGEAAGVAAVAGAAVAAGAAGAGVGLGEAFVSSAREVAPVAETRTTTAPTKANKRIFSMHFIIV